MGFGAIELPKVVRIIAFLFGAITLFVILRPVILRWDAMPWYQIVVGVLAALLLPLPFFFVAITGELHFSGKR